MSEARRRGISWELVGLFALVAVAAIGAVMWRLSPSGRGEPVPPTHITIKPGTGLPSGTTPDGRPYLGRTDAPVTVVQISDFQCPFCRTFVLSSMDALIARSIAPGDVRLEFVTVAFDGPESLTAGVAALCAAAQDRFWPMHDWLYANQSPLQNAGGFSRERLLQLAIGAGVDVDRLARCLDEPQMQARIAANEVYARRESVDSTPAFVIGDRVVTGGDLAAIESIVADALAR